MSAINPGERVRHVLTGRAGTVVSVVDGRWLRVLPDGPLHEEGDAGVVDWVSDRVQRIEEAA